MKVVILAGGFGSRLGEYTNLVPKPMLKIGDKPIIWHIMNYFAGYGFKDFYIALGYKSEVIADYFLNFTKFNNDISLDLSNGKYKTHTNNSEDWNIHLIHTGLNTMTGGRIKKMREYIGNDTFFVTYGDGLSNVNLNKILDFHKSHKKLVTITAVHPVARFGELEIKENNSVSAFKEKPQTNLGWINGGFFLMQPEFIDYIDDDQTILEKEPLENAAFDGELMAFKHDGFWQCMDTKRDMNLLNDLWTNNKAPWKI